MREWEKRKKWLTKKAIWRCLLLSAGILIVAAFYQMAQMIVTSNIPVEWKGFYMIPMWLLLAGFILFYALLSPDLMDIVFNMLGFKEPKKDKTSIEEKKDTEDGNE